MASLIRVIAVVLMTCATSGCSIFAIATTKHEVLSEERYETRTTSRRATVDGSYCYVDHHMRVTKKAHVDSIFGVGGASEALLAGLVATFPGKALYMLPFVLDGLVSFIYWKAAHRKERKTTEWKETVETSSCKTPLKTIASSSDSSSSHDVPLRGPASRDSDHDGIMDDADACTFGAEDKDSFLDDDGCPEDDNDRDGIADSADKCTNESEDKDAFADDDGCPDIDNDGDGVVDAADRCVNDAEDKDGFEDSDGCVDTDNDKDGILDRQDKCPNVAEDWDRTQDDDGCVDVDDDSDGVADTADKCPGKAETKNGYQDTDGCADEVPANVKRSLGVVHGVRFAASSNELAKGPNPALDRIATFLAKNPDLRIAVELHAMAPLGVALDATVAAQTAQRAADAIREYLVARGVAATRLVAVGFDDRLANARVELALISDLVPSRQPGKTP